MTSHSPSFRGTSLCVLLMWVFFGLAIAFGINLPPLGAAVLCLGLLNSAYMAEVYRSGLGIVGFGQWEAARSLGVGGVVGSRIVFLCEAQITEEDPCGQLLNSPCEPRTRKYLSAIRKH